MSWKPRHRGRPRAHPPRPSLPGTRVLSEEPFSRRHGPPHARVQAGPICPAPSREDPPYTPCAPTEGKGRVLPCPPRALGSSNGGSYPEPRCIPKPSCVPCDPREGLFCTPNPAHLTPIPSLPTPTEGGQSRAPRPGAGPC